MTELSNDFLSNCCFSTASPTFSKPLPEFGSKMRFSNLLQGNRQAVFTTTGTIASDIASFQGGNMTFMMEPTWGVLDPMLRLERSIEVDEEALLHDLEVDAITLDRYMRRPTLNSDNMIRVKLPLNKNADFNFTCSDPNFTPDTASLRLGAPVKATFTAGFYFDEVNLRYGLFYSLKRLDLTGDWLERVQPTRVLKRGEPIPV